MKKLLFRLLLLLGVLLVYSVSNAMAFVINEPQNSIAKINAEYFVSYVGIGSDTNGDVLKAKKNAKDNAIDDLRRHLGRKFDIFNVIVWYAEDADGKQYAFAFIPTNK